MTPIFSDNSQKHHSNDNMEQYQYLMVVLLPFHSEELLLICPDYLFYDSRNFCGMALFPPAVFQYGCQLYRYNRNTPYYARKW